MRNISSGLLISVSSMFVIATACGGGTNNSTAGAGGLGGETTGSGGSDSGTGGKATGGTDTGGTTASTGGKATGGGSSGGAPSYSILGAWEQVCPGGMGGVAITCADGPWELYLAAEVLGGPTTVYSVNSSCDDPDSGEYRGTFAKTSTKLTLNNCAGVKDASKGFQYTLTMSGEHLILTDLDTTYVYEFDRIVKPASVLDVRLLDATGDCSDAGIHYYVVDPQNFDAFAGTQTIQDGKLIMDEFFTNGDGTGSGSWGFYEADDRGAQNAQYPTATTSPVTNYRITWGPDLTPLWAVGFEQTDCSDPTTIKGYEYDLAHKKTYRRFWSTSSTAIGSASTIDVAGLTGTVKEAIVTVRTSGLADIAATTITLESPDGTKVVLSSNNDGDGSFQDYDYATFLDGAPQSVTSAAVTSFDVTLDPENPLSVLVGESLNGTWKLTADSAADGGQLTYFGISLR